MDFVHTREHLEQIRQRECSPEGYPFVLSVGDYLTLHHRESETESVMQLS